jgi:hypothetical protein
MVTISEEEDYADRGGCNREIGQPGVIFRVAIVRELVRAEGKSVILLSAEDKN